MCIRDRSYTGIPLKEFIKKYTNSNIAFVLPSMNISGGIMVALKHAVILQDAGEDVVILNVDNKVAWCEHCLLYTSRCV